MHSVWRIGGRHAARSGVRWGGDGVHCVPGTGREGCVAQCLRVLGGVVHACRRYLCGVGGVWGNGNSGRRDDRPPAHPGNTVGAAHRRGDDGGAGAYPAAHTAEGPKHRRDHAGDGQTSYAGQSINRHRKSRAGTANGAERDFFKPYGGGRAAGDAFAEAAGRKRDAGNRPAAHRPVRHGFRRRRVLRHRDRQRGAERGGKRRARRCLSLPKASARRLRCNHRRQFDG